MATGKKRNAKKHSKGQEWFDEESVANRTTQTDLTAHVEKLSTDVHTPSTSREVLNAPTLTTIREGSQAPKFSDFDIGKFNPEKHEWPYFIRRLEFGFEFCQVPDDFRKGFLLAKIGMESFQLIVDQVYPREVSEITYDEIKNVLQKHFSKNYGTLSERLQFSRRVRKEGESVLDFLTSLRHAARHCEFGISLDERLRDQFILGLENTLWQQEILKTFPNNASTLSQVEKLALLLESTANQQQLLGNSTSYVHQGINSVKNKSKTILKMGVHCYRCGGKVHSKNIRCPALKVKCNSCGVIGHFKRACFKAGFAVKSEFSQKIQKVSLDSENDHESDEGLNNLAINSVTGKEVYVLAKINDVKIRMLYDSGAGKSVIGEKVWELIGRPSLQKSPNLVAYSGVQIETLGTAKVKVQAFSRAQILPVTVVKVHDKPLFGLDWILKFNLPLPPNAQICSLNDSDRTQSNNCHPEHLKRCLAKFEQLFSSSTGCIKGHKAVVHLKQNAVPVVCKPRIVPFALRHRVELELDRLVAEDILEPIDSVSTPVEWASPIVVVLKPTGKVRICGDFKVSINRQIHVQQHPLPRFEEIMEKMAGGKYFSTIDLKDAYLQMEVEESSRKYLVIATHKGYYSYKRLPFGVAFAPAIFQKAMEDILTGIGGTAVYLDDIIITANSVHEHFERLNLVLNRLQQAGMRVREEKCKFFKEDVQYLGHIIDQSGIRPTSTHIEAIKNMATPKNTTELRSFLGTVNYYSRFVQNLQLICAPLHRLLKKNCHWNWTRNDDEIITQLKSMLTSHKILVHYDPNLPLVISTDASDRGIGAVLAHQYENGEEKPIAFASRTLTPTETKYSAIDKEALAIVFAVKKFHQWIFARNFTLQTDHRPLVHILGQSKNMAKIAANRLTRWAMLLSNYSFEIKHKSGKENFPADTLSRLPSASETISPEELEGDRLGKMLYNIRLEDVALNKQHLRNCVAKNSLLAKVKAFIVRGWPNSSKHIAEELRTFYEKREELSCEEEILLWNGRLVIPPELQSSVLTTLHEGHPGITAMKMVARLHVWWPGMDSDIEKHVKRCTSCQTSRPKESEMPLFSWSVPSKPWTRIHVDFAGIFKGKYWMVVVDATSKWVEIIPMQRITTTNTTTALREMFARFGLPEALVSDNGPQFTSKDFKMFCDSNNIRHIKTTPYHPRSNGLAERMVKTFKQRMKASINTDLVEALHKFLFSYRNTQQCTTGRTPAEIMFKRRLITKLDLLKPDLERNIDHSISKQKVYHDRSKTGRFFEEGEKVWAYMDNQREKRFLPGTIIKQTNPYSYRVDVDGQEHRKHADQLKSRFE